MNIEPTETSKEHLKVTNHGDRTAHSIGSTFRALQMESRSKKYG